MSSINLEYLNKLTKSLILKASHIMEFCRAMSILQCKDVYPFILFEFSKQNQDTLQGAGTHSHYLQPYYEYFFPMSISLLR